MPDTLHAQNVAETHNQTALNSIKRRCTLADTGLLARKHPPHHHVELSHLSFVTALSSVPQQYVWHDKQAGQKNGRWNESW